MNVKNESIYNEVLLLAVDALGKIFYELDLEKEFSHFNSHKIRKIIHKMSRYGWYADDFTKETGINFTACLQNIYSNLVEKMDEHLMDYYRNRLPVIEDKIKTQYPKRTLIISEAILAHNNGMYHSSINLFLTLIDGICFDTFNKKFFLNKNNLPEVLDSLSKKEMIDFLIAPIHKKGALNAWEKQLHFYPIRLNRNEIVHGVDVNYGTEVNSLKTLSLLAYVDTILGIYKSDYNSPIPLSNKRYHPFQ